MKKLKLPPVEEVGDDVILHRINAEEATEIELERTTVPEEASILARALFRS